jgi:hypothetical protein
MPQQGAAYKGAILPKAAPGASPPRPPGVSRSAGVGKVTFKALPQGSRNNAGQLPLGRQMHAEAKQADAKLPKPSGASSGILGTIEAGPQLAAAAISDIPKIPGAIASDVPKELHGGGFIEGGLKSAAQTFGTVETKGYENLLGSKGIGGSIAKTIGDGLREIPELPAQVIPTLYEGGRAVVDAHEGNNRPLESLGKGLVKESVVAHLAKGELGQAVSTLKNRPVSSALEVSGVGGAADRLAGAAARSGALGEDMASKAALAEPGSTDLSRQPQDLLGNAREPLPPKSKRLSTALRQDAHDRTVRPGETIKEQIKDRGLGQRLTRHLDSKNGDIRSIQKHNVNEAVHARMDAVAGKRVPGTSLATPIAGHGAVNLFARGILADPKVVDHITGQPLYRTQLKDLTEYHATPVDGETLQEKALRESNVAHAQALLDDQRLQRDPQKAYMAAGKYAKDMKTLEPAVKDATGLSDESARAAKLTDPFMFHWRDQDPLVSEGENGTEFSVAKPRAPSGLPTGGRTIMPIEQVERQLKDEHGVDADHVGFVSNRPYINKDAQYYKNGQDPARAGYYPQKFRSGNAFKRGQYDPSHEALVTQHVANQGIVDQVHAARMQVKDYFLTREHVAKLLEEKDPKSPLIQDLRSGKSTYFGSGQGTSAWTKAQQAAAEIRQAHPDLRLVPGRIAAPYAGKDYLGKLSQDAHDVLDPNRIDDERGGNLADAFPKDEEIQHTAGSVGLVHADVAKHMDAYSKQQGSAFGKLLRAPANFWRVSNIALSPKHPIGIAQELGIRAAVNNIGPMSLLREHRMSNLWERALEDPDFLKDNPGVENQYALMRSKIEGTESKQALQLQEHITSKDVGSASRSGALLRAAQKATDHTIAGAPLRVAQHVLKAYNTVTKDILRFQNKVLGGPALKAGLGKAVNDEVKRLTGSSIPLIHEMDDRTKEVILGQVTNPNALAATGRKLIEYYGDWTKASPKTKNILAVAPFWNWYANSMKFIYHTLPMNHPIKTALLTTLEGATKAQRQAIGQGAGSFEKLEPEQQGGIPIGHGYTSTPQHYTPFGAVNEPLATLTGLWLPEIQDAYKAATGTNPFGETLENASKEPITSEKERARYAALGLLESFLPPLRTVATALSGGRSRQGTETYGTAKEDPVGRALGISPGIWKAIEPLRIAQERTETGVRGGTRKNGEVVTGKEVPVGKEAGGGREAAVGREVP